MVQSLAFFTYALVYPLAMFKEFKGRMQNICGEMMHMIIKIKNSKKILTAGEIQIQILLIIGNIVQRKI